MRTGKDRLVDGVLLEVVVVQLDPAAVGAQHHRNPEAEVPIEEEAVYAASARDGCWRTTS